MATRWVRAIIGGIVGVFAGAAAAFPLLFAVGPATVFNDELQSPKLQAVWNELEPLPLMVSNPLAFAGLLAVVGVAHGLVFAVVAGGLPVDRVRRGLAFGFIVWLMSHLFFELNAPFALLGEPLPLVGVELGVQLVGALVEGIVVSFIYGWHRQPDVEGAR